MDREVNAFKKLYNYIPDTKCMIITNSEESEFDVDGIKIPVVPVWKWLINDKIL